MKNYFQHFAFKLINLRLNSTVKKPVFDPQMLKRGLENGFFNEFFSFAVKKFLMPDEVSRVCLFIRIF